MRFLIRLLIAALSLMLGVGTFATKLRLATWDGDKALETIRETARAFERANPGIEVVVEPVAYGNYHDKLLAQIAAGVAPDITLMDPANFMRYATRDAIWNLNELSAQDTGFDLRAYYPPIVAAHSLDGNLYVLPRDIAPIGLIYYNKKIFDEVGLPYPDGTWTWDYEPRPELGHKDFYTVVQKLTKKGKNGKVERYGFSPGWPTAITDVFMYSAGGAYLDDPARPTKLRTDEPVAIKAMDLLRRMMFEDKIVPSSVELSTSLMASTGDLFVQGRVAMMQTGIWEVPNLRKKLVPGTKDFFEWDITLVPAYKDGTQRMPTGGSGYSILKQTPNPEAAWKLVKWMAGPEGMDAMARAGIAQPAIPEIARREPWVPGPNTPLAERYPPSRILTDTAVPSVVFDPVSENWPEVKLLLASYVDRIWMGSMTPEQALKEGTAIAQRRLDERNQAQKAPPFPWGAAGAVALLVVGGLAAWVYWPERGVQRTAKEKHENRMAYLFIAPWIIGLVAFTLGPMLLSLMMSFSNWDIIRNAEWRGLGNYQEMVTTDNRFWVSLKVTMVYTLVSVPLGIMVALALALLLNLKVKGMPIWRTLYYLPALGSGVAVALIWKAVFKADGGLLNTLIYGPTGDGNPLGLATLLSGLANPGEPINWLGNEKTALGSLILMSVWGAGGGMVVLLAGLQGIPELYYEAARVDGASAWRRFWSVTLPMLSPALLFSLITGFIGSFQAFTQAYVMTAGGPGDATRFFLLHLYEQAFVGLRMGYASALAWVLFAIVFVFTLAQLKLKKFVYYEGEDAR